ncbi:MAG TPA: DUF4325 domain-containing protein [Thermoplasmata archaeon]
MISRTKTINVASMLTPNLALRDTASKFVRYVEGLPNPEVILDFSDVRTITRSFAHEYCTRKRDLHKRITETNVSPDVAKMFAVVQDARAKRTSRTRIDFEGIPVVNL